MSESKPFRSQPLSVSSEYNDYTNQGGNTGINDSSLYWDGSFFMCARHGTYLGGENPLWG